MQQHRPHRVERQVCHKTHTHTHQHQCAAPRKEVPQVPILKCSYRTAAIAVGLAVSCTMSTDADAAVAAAATAAIASTQGGSRCAHASQCSFGSSRAMASRAKANCRG